MDAQKLKSSGAVEASTIFAGILGVITACALFSSILPNDKARDALPQTNLHSQTPLKLVGARGDDVSFYIRGEVLGKVRWRSAGLYLEIGGERYQVVKARRKDWGEAIQVGNQPTDDLEIRGDFRVPDFPGPETRTLKGKLTGSVTSAQASGSGFTNETDQLDVPVELKLVSAEKGAGLREKEQAPIRTQRTIGFGIAAVAGVIALILTGVAIWANWVLRRARLL